MTSVTFCGTHTEILASFPKKQSVESFPRLQSQQTPLSRLSRTRIHTTMPKCDQAWLQRSVVECAAARLPLDELHSPPQHGHGKLEGLLREAKERHVPNASTRGLRKWWKHFLLHGECKAVIDRSKRHRCRQHGRRSKRGNWDDNKSTTLKATIDAKPELHLDEIQACFHKETGEMWSLSTLRKRLVSDCGCSLQVATDRSTKQQQKEIDEHLAELSMRVSNPSMLVCIDESAKDRNSSRRRRSWSRRGLAPFRRSHLAGQQSRTSHRSL